MPKDELDPSLAAAFAWAHAFDREQANRLADVQHPPPAPKPPAPPAASPPEGDPRVGQVAQRLDRLVSRRIDVEDVRDLVHDDRLVDEVLDALAPDVGIRLASLLHDQVDALGEAEQQRAAKVAARAVSLQSRDSARYLEALVRRGHPHFCAELEPLLRVDDGGLRRASRRLGPVLWAALGDPTTPPWGCALAAHLLACGTWKFDRAAARRALAVGTWPGWAFVLRALARRALLRSVDLERLLDRILEQRHTLGRRDLDKRSQSLARQLREALEEVLPALPTEALRARLLTAERAGDVDSLAFPPLTALRALARAFPDHAAQRLRYRLLQPDAELRADAAAALGCLPAPLALPLRRRAWRDPLAAVRALAGAVGDPLGLFPPRLRPRPGSPEVETLATGDDSERRELFLSVVARVRARRPRRGDAALLLALLCDPYTAPSTADLISLPDWCVSLHPQLGAALEEALLALSRSLGLPDKSGPLDALAALHGVGRLSRGALARARRLALEALARAEGDDAWQAAWTVEVLGAPWQAWRLLYDKLPDHPGLRHALASLGRCRALDAQLDANLHGPLSPEYEATLVELGIRRGRPRAIARGLDLLGRAQTADEVAQVLKWAKALLEVGRLARAELLRELQHPQSPRFNLGLAAIPEGPLSAEVLGALERATREGPEEHVDGALDALSDARAYPPQDPRWVEALRRASPDWALHTVRGLLAEGASRELLAPKVRELLASDDAELVELTVGVLETSEAGVALLAAARALPDGPPGPSAARG